MRLNTWNQLKGYQVNIHSIDEFTKGWFVGNFEPSLIKNDNFEVSVKWFNAGEVEPNHAQIVATEITVVIAGEIELGGRTFVARDVISIPPGEFATFRAITDSVLVCVKSPSLPSDKIFG